MVLEDTLFRDMSLETLLKCTRPKVEGSLHLNELFQDPDHPLDFFVFFSSATTIPGNLGQSNYTAANLFMTALAQQRRQRGLAASVMHIGPILGVGYLAQEGLTSEMQTLSQSFVFLSEQDFYAQFAEAVVAGRPGTSAPLEIATGVAKAPSPAEATPLMSHYTEAQVEASGQVGVGNKSTVPLKTQLAEARGTANVSRIISSALLPKLSSLFQTDLDSLEKADLSTLRLDEMGIDSLLAVEIRGWFVKSIEVNIPVLKILSGVSVADLIAIATETIPAALVPNINADPGEAPPEPVKSKPQSAPVKAASPAKSTPVEPKQAPQSVKVSGSPEPVRFTQQLSEKPTSDQMNSLSSSRASIDADYSPANYSPETVPTPPADDTDTLDGSFVSIMPPKQALEELQSVQQAPVLEKSVKLAFSQNLFWFSQAFSEDKTSLNLTGAFRMAGNVRIPDLKKAVQALGKQHESLRTCFFERDGQVMQGIMSISPLVLECQQIDNESEFTRYFNEIHNCEYDLARGKTVRLALLSLSPTQHFFIIGLHHVAIDGTSFQPLMADLLRHYTAGPQNIPTRQYSEFSEKQHADFAAGRWASEMTFWKNELADLPPALPILRLSDVKSRPALEVFGNARVDLFVEPATKSLIQAACRRARATPFHFYLSVFRVLIWRYTAAEHVGIGIGDANRTEDGMMGSIGSFVNVLPLIFHTQAASQFDALLQETRSKTYSALANSHVPFQVLLNE